MLNTPIMNSAQAYKLCLGLSFCALRGAACSASRTKTNIILVLYYACTRVNWPIIDRLLMIEHFGRSLSILLHFESFKFVL